jgi:type VI secretion system protein ImpL
MMTRPTKAWLIAGAVLVAYLVVAVLIVLAMGLHGRAVWQVVGALGVLGLASATIVLWFFRDELAQPAEGSPAGSIDATLAAARGRLAAAKLVREPSFGALPVLLVLGPTGSTKTTVIVRSELGPELLAGDVFRGETVTPTPGVNLWFSQGTVVAEAGGSLLVDGPAWGRLVRALRPRSLVSALTGRPQPPRFAVVCFGCDEFYKPGSGETVSGAARVLRARLGEAAKQFGVQLPTYVLFTKLDAVPNFDAYMRNFSVEEAREPLGAAVTPDSGGAGTYADRVTPQLERAVDALFSSLAERRLAVLTREHSAEPKPAAYEFPREFRKLAPLAVDFLRELGRPSELEVSPVLRGFYFIGVQAVFITEAVPEYSPVPRQPQTVGVRSATAVFSASVAVASAVAPAPQSTRKVPRWDFLPRLFREVVFGDAAAVRATSAGARVGFWRRTGLAAALIGALGFALAFTSSYGANRRLQMDALDATRGIASLPPNPVDLPQVDPLRRLDALRSQLDTLSRYEHAGAPLGLRWGLYNGSTLYPEVRKAYFGGFRKIMFGGTYTAMLTALRSLPDTPRPTDDYGDSYALLKAYIITTSHPEKSTLDFLPSALMTRWVAGRPLDSARAQLGRRQFETYATELRYANPFTDTADVSAVTHARSFLRQFAGSERIYQFILAEAAKTNPAIQFNRRVPGSSQFVVDPYQVPGAFTKGGSVFVLSALKTIDKYLTGESWVVGDGGTPVDQAKLVADLRARYTADYASHWRHFLQSASVTRYGGIRDAAQKLAVLSGNQSPLLALFAIASQNTAIALPDVANAFQPVQAVTPPAVTDKLIGPSNAPYVNALVSLQSSLDQTANAQGPAAEAAAGQASSNASAAKTAARQIASGFTIDESGQVHAIVQSLLEAPITNVEPMLRNFGAAEINVRARTFCAAARPVLAKFPFASEATAQASLAEVAGLLRPGSGRLWRFYDDALQAVLPRQGSQYVPAGGGNVRFSPGFLTFLNRARVFADILFTDDSPEPHLSFMVSPTPSEAFTSVAVSLDGEVVRSSASGNLASARIDWPGSGHEAKLSAGLGSTEATLVGPYVGPWAVFQLFSVADEWRQVANGYRVGWELSTRAQRAVLPTGGGAKVIIQIDGGPATAVLRKGFFAGADCQGDIVR